MQFTPSRKTTTGYFDIQRRVVANKTLEGWLEAPHVSLLLEMEVDPVLDWVRAAKAHPSFGGSRVTVNAVLLRLVAEALRAAPEMNAHVSYGPHSAVGRVTCFEEVNIAIPFRSADGRMITPVLKDVAALSMRGVCEGMEDLRARAANTDVDMLLREAGVRDTLRRLFRLDPRVLWRLWANFLGPGRLPRVSAEARRRWRDTPPDRRVTPENLLSATVLVSNVGSTAPRGQYFAAPMIVIIQPQTTAIALGAVVRRPVVVPDGDGERITAHSILPLTIVFDHRVMDLEHVLPFMERLRACCLDPAAVLA